MIYFFHGPDAFSRSEAVATLKQRLFAADPLAELNYLELDGQRASLAEVRAAADALPFMGERRMVVIAGLVTRCNPRAGGGDERTELASGLKAWLPELPPSTRLLFLDEALAANNPVLTWAQKWRAEQPVPDEAAVIRTFPAPAAAALPRWLATRANAKGGAIEPAAATALSQALDIEGQVDLRLADSELEKLLTYAGDRPVTADDVARLVTPVGLEKIFAFTDALARRDGPAAATLLQTFLDHNEPPLRLMALVARQIRQLVVAQALLASGVGPSELPSRLGVPPFVAQKLAQQAQHFTRPSPTAALRRLLELETAIKTGRMDADLGLDLFVAGVCGARGVGRERGARV